MRKNTPPRRWIAFLEWFCPDELLESILGDLLEQFDAEVEELGPRRARRHFRWTVLRFLHPSILFRHHLTVKFIPMGLLKNHLRVAVRSMLKYRFYSVINILGLSLAMAFLFLSFLFIRQELSYDQFHSKADRTYRLYHKVFNAETGQLQNASAVTSIPVGRDLAENLPIIEHYTRFASTTGTILDIHTPYEEIIHFVDPGFLQTFDFPMLEGDRTSALDNNGTIVLSEVMAEKYFGAEAPLGKSLQLQLNDTIFNLQVTGIIDPQKRISSIPFDFLVLIELYRMSGIISTKMFDSYNLGIAENYIQLKSPLPQQELEDLLTTTIQPYVTDGNDRFELGAQPLADIHLEHEIIGNAQYTHPRRLYILMALSLLVLVVSSINFITLSTSHSLNRIKEIGLRKTLGALKGQLRRQLVAESALVCLISAVLAVSITAFILPFFADLVGSPMQFRFGWQEAGLMTGLILLIAWVSGRLQGLLLVRQQIVDAVIGKFKVGKGKSLLNDGLVVLQFALSILLIIGAVHIRAQMRYIQQKDLGFNQERLLEINMNNSDDKAKALQLVERFRVEVLNYPQVLEVSAAMNNTREPWTQLGFLQDNGENEQLFFNQIDPNYLSTMGIQLLEGSNFKPDRAEAGTAILVNEALLRHFGWQDFADKQLPGKNFDKAHRIIGVVEDFHFSSLHQKIEPLILALDDKSIGSGITGLSTYVWPPNLYQLLVRIGPGELEPVIQQLEQSWKAIAPDRPFIYHFVDDNLEAAYAEEQRWGKVVDWASIFAVSIAWLGLLGLMRLSVQKRTKEIGIRKVLGSSIQEVITLLSRRYLVLVILGCLIAWPMSWILLQRWLESFSYRISLSPWLFILVGLGVLIIALCSVGWQALGAARRNPVEALRME